jgi:AcrR family transcriptional regulator
MAADPALVLPPRAAARRDGEASRERLLLAALALFSQHGYARASTRDIAVAAGANVAAIAYYFGDKAGLYRAVFDGPVPMVWQVPAEAAGDAPALPAVLRGFFGGYIEPLKQGDLARQVVKLHMRELTDPTGLWPRSIVDAVKPMHDWLVATLSAHLGLARPDDDVRRLAICIAALGVHQHVACDVIGGLAPRLVKDDEAFDLWVDRLVLYATGMVEAERKRRARAAKERA